MSHELPAAAQADFPFERSREATGDRQRPEQAEEAAGDAAAMAPTGHLAGVEPEAGGLLLVSVLAVTGLDSLAAAESFLAAAL